MQTIERVDPIDFLFSKPEADKIDIAREKALGLYAAVKSVELINTNRARGIFSIFRVSFRKSVSVIYPGKPGVKLETWLEELYGQSEEVAVKRQTLDYSGGKLKPIDDDYLIGATFRGDFKTREELDGQVLPIDIKLERLLEIEQMVGRIVNADANKINNVSTYAV